MIRTSAGFFSIIEPGPSKPGKSGCRILRTPGNSWLPCNRHGQTSRTGLRGASESCELSIEELARTDPVPAAAERNTSYAADVNELLASGPPSGSLRYTRFAASLLPDGPPTPTVSVGPTVSLLAVVE